MAMLWSSFNCCTTSLDSNLATIIKNDGSLIGVGRGALYRAVNWRDPKTYRFYPTRGAGGEVSVSSKQYSASHDATVDTSTLTAIIMLLVGSVCVL